MEKVTKSNIDKNFGKVLRDFRLKKKMTQEQLSENLGISLKYISRIENGNNGVKTQTLINYMNLLGITPNLIYKPFITDKEVAQNIEITERIASLPEEKQRFLLSIIDLLDDTIE